MLNFFSNQNFSYFSFIFLIANLISFYCTKTKKLPIIFFSLSLATALIAGVVNFISCPIILLFGFQADILIENPAPILMVATPIILQSFLMFGLAYFWMYKAKIPHNISAPASLISSSNFFELAVAVAIGLFGLNSGASFATVVGVLVEVPVMLLLVNIANKTSRNQTT